MKNMFPGPIRKQLLAMLNARTDEEAATDELSSVLLQISLAIMLIFMIAFFLFMGKVGGEIEQLDNLKSQLADAEREQLLQALEKTAEKYRIQYGLKEFLRIEPATGERVYEFTDVVSKGELNREGFKVRAVRVGAAAARKDYQNLPLLEEQWREIILKACPEAAERNPFFLKENIHEKVLQIKREVLEIQTLAAAKIQEHLAQNPQLVQNQEILALLSRINSSPDSPDRIAQLRDLNEKLRSYVYDLLGTQSGTQMLEDETK